MEISYIIEFELTAVIGVITFFLKRTIDELANWKAADFCEDNRLDVFDMI